MPLSTPLSYPFPYKTEDGLGGGGDSPAYVSVTTSGLVVTSSATINNATLTGTTTVVGPVNQTGNFVLTGDLTVTGTITGTSIPIGAQTSFTATGATNQFLVSDPGGVFELQTSTSTSPTFNFNNSAATTVNSTLVFGHSFGSQSANAKITSSQVNSSAGVSAEGGYTAVNDTSDTLDLVMSSSNNTRRGTIRTSAAAFGLDISVLGASKSIKLSTNSTARLTVDDTAVTTASQIVQTGGGRDTSVAVVGGAGQLAGVAFDTTASGSDRWNIYGDSVGGALQVYDTSTNTTAATFKRTGQVVIPTSIASTSTATGALVVGGGAGVGGDLWVGGTLHATGSVGDAGSLQGATWASPLPLGSASPAAVAATTLAASGAAALAGVTATTIGASSTVTQTGGGRDGSFVATGTQAGIALDGAGSDRWNIYSESSGGALSVLDTSTSVTAATFKRTGQLSVPTSVTSTSTTTGSLVVGGGVGVGGDLWVGGVVHATSFSGGTDANTLLGKTWAAPAAIGSTTPTTGKFTTVESTVATGTAPLIVASTTNVPNLNSSLLLGSTWTAPGTIGSGTATTGRFTTVESTASGGTAPLIIASTTVVPNLNSSFLQGSTWAVPGAIGSTTATTGRFTTVESTVTTGTAPLAINSTTVVPNLNVNYLQGAIWASPLAIGTSTASTGRFTQVESTVATGTAPLVVASTTNVPNLNSSTLLGSTWAAPSPIGTSTPATGKFTTVESVVTTGTAPLIIASTTVVPNLNSNYLQGGTWAVPPVLGSTTPNDVNCVALTATGEMNGNLGISLWSGASRTTGLLRMVADAGTTYIQSGLQASSGSAADLVFSTIYGGSTFLRMSGSTGSITHYHDTDLTQIVTVSPTTTNGNATVRYHTNTAKSGNYWEVGHSNGSGVNANGLAFYSSVLGGQAAWMNTNGSMSTNNKLSINGGQFFDYYHGDFLPTFIPCGSDVSGYNVIYSTSTTRSGSWIKNGRMVTISFTLPFFYGAWPDNQYFLIGNLPFNIHSGVTIGLDMATVALAGSKQFTFPFVASKWIGQAGLTPSADSKAIILYGQSYVGLVPGNYDFVTLDAAGSVTEQLYIGTICYETRDT